MRNSKALRSWSQWLLSGVIAVLGAALFVRLSIPLPFILGPMVLCLIAALIKLPVAMPAPLRPPMSAIIGVMLGAGFTPAVLSHLSTWIGTVLGLVVFLVLSALVTVTYYRRIAGYDGGTAYFAGMPGGMLEMTLLGEQFGADVRRMALAHSARILLVVFALPFLIRVIIGEDLGPGTPRTSAPLTTESILWLAGTAVAGMILGRWLKLPARNLLGPMVLSAVIHASGISTFDPPSVAVVGAQVVIGAAIGCRFAGLRVVELVSTLFLAAGATALQLLVMVLCAFSIAYFVPFEPIDLFLAYSPGGVTEMGLIAVALGSDVAFVAAHHIIRVVMVSAGAGLFAKKMMQIPQGPPI